MTRKSGLAAVPGQCQSCDQPAERVILNLEDYSTEVTCIPCHVTAIMAAVMQAAQDEGTPATEVVAREENQHT
jgi:hypothetical protein